MYQILLTLKPLLTDCTILFDYQSTYSRTELLMERSILIVIITLSPINFEVLLLFYISHQFPTRGTYHFK